MEFDSQAVVFLRSTHRRYRRDIQSTAASVPSTVPIVRYFGNHRVSFQRQLIRRRVDSNRLEEEHDIEQTIRK